MSAHDVQTHRVALAAAALAAVVAGAAGVVLAWLHIADVPPGGASTGAAPTGVPATPLQSAPQLDLATYRAEKFERLHGSGWIDAQHGIAHIPIEDAMALLARRAAEGDRG